jgi:hypothetical protein
MAEANTKYPLLDRFAVCWADLSLRVNAPGVAPLTTGDFASLDSESSVSVGEQTLGLRPYATTVGELSHSGSMSLYLSGALLFDSALQKAAAQDDYIRDGEIYQLSPVLFEIYYAFRPIAKMPIIERMLRGCRVLKESEKLANKSDAVTVDYTIHVTERLKKVNGVWTSLR